MEVESDSICFLSLCNATLRMNVGSDDAQGLSSWARLNLEAQKQKVTGQCSSCHRRNAEKSGFLAKALTHVHNH